MTGALTERDVEAARAMAVAAHGAQAYGDKPYSWHLDEVVRLCEPYGTKAMVAGYLHDTLEDTALQAQAIEYRFGADVLEVVTALTDPPGATRKERKTGSYAKLGAIDAASPRSLALIVKAADRLANIRACVATRNTRQFEVYRDEQSAFHTAVHRPGLNDELLAEIATLLASDPG